ncbi:carbohydrate ABC transporter permease [Paenibacillus thalictri]|uniref:Sugar ABC transporter permease n=1 Tax=Paenibacillus thalictri TaxID=2527873 RepID=A0A4V2J3V1_9BACL|nr:sugar ABC transporter permease [Paenibacillus thalictri]TBL75734.1 sugar ABC transporter permease [Paenibacillus thalictri]
MRGRATFSSPFLTSFIIAPGGGIALKRQVVQGEWAGFYFALPAIFIMLALIAYPLVYGVGISFFDTNLLNKYDFRGLTNYLDVLTDSGFLKKLYITVKFTIMVVVGNFVVGFAFAMLLNMNIKGRAFFRAILVLPWLFPEVVVALIWKWLFNPLYGLLNYYLMEFHLVKEPLDLLGNPQLALISVAVPAIWKGFSLVLVMILAGLQSISQDLYEAAEIDGANVWQLIRNVTVPGLMPVLTVTLILETVWWFKHFTIIYLLTSGGPVDATSVLSIDIYKQAFEQFQFGRASAMAVLVFLICLLISYVYRRMLKEHD